MIDDKSFMEFFEKEFNVKFVDAKTGESAADIISRNREKNTNQYNDTEYNSDYDVFLEEGDNNDEA